MRLSICHKTEGLQKVELVQWPVLQAEGLYGLLRGVHISFPHVHGPTSSQEVLPSPYHSPYPGHPLKSLKKVEPESFGPIADEGILAQEAPSLTISQALEVAIPANMTPLCLNVGGIKRVL